MSEKWFDPACYRMRFLYFGQETYLPALHEAFGELLTAALPCWEKWLSASPGFMAFGCPPVGRTYDDLLKCLPQLCRIREAQQEVFLRVEARAMPPKFAVPLRSIDKAWRVEAEAFLSEDPAKDPDGILRKLHRILNCPSDDLRGFPFPKRAFKPSDSRMSVSYTAVPWRGIFVGPDSPVLCTQHEVAISIPRMVLDAMEMAFPFQEAWQKLLCRLCERFLGGMGCIELDTASSDVLPAFGPLTPLEMPGSRCIPGTAWGMALSPQQAVQLPPRETLLASGVFRAVVPLDGGGLYLQLTEDVSCVSRAASAAQWRLLAPYLYFDPYATGSFYDTPASMRLGLSLEEVELVPERNFRMYRFNPRES